jgi:hypothetical protein
VRIRVLNSSTTTNLEINEFLCLDPKFVVFQIRRTISLFVVVFSSLHNNTNVGIYTNLCVFALDPRGAASSLWTPVGLCWNFVGGVLFRVGQCGQVVAHGARIGVIRAEHGFEDA